MYELLLPAAFLYKLCACFLQEVFCEAVVVTIIITEAQIKGPEVCYLR